MKTNRVHAITRSPQRRRCAGLLATAVLVLAACGGDDDDVAEPPAATDGGGGVAATDAAPADTVAPAATTEDSSPGSPAPDTAAPDTAADSAPAGGADLEGSVSFGIAAEFLPLVEGILDEFQAANPGVDLEIQSYPLDQYPTVLQTNLGAGSPPDVFVAETGGQLAALASAELVVDLTDHLDIDVPGSVSDLFGPGGGRLFGLPLGTIAQAAVYNQDVFDQAGVAVPETFADVLGACDTLNAAGVTPIALAGADPDQAGITVMSIAASTVYADNPSFTEELLGGGQSFTGGGFGAAFDRYVELRDAGCFGDAAAGQSLPEVHQQVAAGRAAMVIERVSILPTIEELNPEGRFSLFPFPAGDSADDTSIIVSVPFTFSVAAASDNQPAAIALVQFIGQPANVDVIARAAEMLPLTIDAAELPESFELLKPVFDANRVVANPNPLWGTTIEEALDLGAQRLLLGGTDVDEILASMDAALADS